MKKPNKRTNGRTGARTNRRTINLWPDAARQLGIGRNVAYAAAARGDIPGVIRIGKRYLVLLEAFERLMTGRDAAA